MLYESLLLGCDGGITDPNSKSSAHTGRAALCIGIGGVGITALSSLKGKIINNLRPDDPDTPFPRYESIQLLAIDADEGEFRKFHGNRRLSDAECFSIKKYHLSDIFRDPTAKELLKQSPFLNWMDVDSIQPLLANGPYYSTRQIGRYLLFDHIASLVQQIQHKCHLATSAAHCTNLNVFIFNSVCGGVGSGCFLDVCYLVRHVLHSMGLTGKLTGYFFLPEVLTSKPVIAADPSSVECCNATGYATLKELDYLMKLQGTTEWFEQRYDATTYIHTQEPPVDTCQLVSIFDMNGKACTFDTAIDLAAECALHGITGYMPNNLPAYSFPNVSKLEIPKRKFYTYLATGFFQKLRSIIHRQGNTVNKNDVTRLFADQHFCAEWILKEVMYKCPELVLPALDPNVLAKAHCLSRGQLPIQWAQAFNNWLALCSAQQQQNMAGLTRTLSSFSYDQCDRDSLIGRLFRALCQLCMDPQYGPYYAASLLANSQYNLCDALGSEIMKVDSHLKYAQLRIPEAEDYVVHCNEDLIHRIFRKKTYRQYEDSVMELTRMIGQIEQSKKVIAVLEHFRAQVKALYTDFFKPLCELLDNLSQTFQDNDSYLTLHTTSCEKEITPLEAVKARFDRTVCDLDPTYMCNRFVDTLLLNSDSWRFNDPQRVSALISKYMLDLFRDETNRSLTDYLLEQFPWFRETDLGNHIEKELLFKAEFNTVPRFPYDPSLTTADSLQSNMATTLCIPAANPVVGQAAAQYVQISQFPCTVYTTGWTDHIFFLRTIDSMPLSLCQTITNLKRSYDQQLNTSTDVGQHLYALTGRGHDGSGHKDWRNTLPDLIS